MLRGSNPNRLRSGPGVIRSLLILIVLALCHVAAATPPISIITLDITDGTTSSAYLSAQTAATVSALLGGTGLSIPPGQFTTSSLSVTSSDAEGRMSAVMANTPAGFFMGGIPSTVTSFNSVLVLDPINSTRSSHEPNPNLIYLFPVLEQQLYMAALYCSRNGISPMATRVLLRNGTNNIASITAAADSAFSFYGLSLPSSSVVVSGATISDELLTSGTTFVVGLTTADVAPLVTFLEDHSDATVIVDFDDLTVLYDTFVTSFGTEYKSAMSRLLYTTNLPRWSRGSSAASKSFAEAVQATYQTPAGMRAYYTVLLSNSLVRSHGSGIVTTTSLTQALYSATLFSVGGMRFGPYSTMCIAPAPSPSSCVVNYNSVGMALWPYAAIVDDTVDPLISPTATPLGTSQEGILNGRDDSPINDSLKVIFVVGGVMLHLLAIIVLRVYFGCFWFIPLLTDSDEEEECCEMPRATSGVVEMKHAASTKDCQVDDSVTSYICVDLMGTHEFFAQSPAVTEKVVHEWHRSISIVAEGFGVSLVHAQRCRFIFCHSDYAKATHFATRVHHELQDNALKGAKELYGMVNTGSSDGQNGVQMTSRVSSCRSCCGVKDDGGEPSSLRLVTHIILRRGLAGCATVGSLPISASWSCRVQ